MSYVIAAYGITLVSLLLYAGHLERSRRELSGRDAKQPDAGGAGPSGA